MSKSPDFVSATPSSPTPLLKPALKAALGSLDVQLEEELSRYRRQRRSEKPLSSVRGAGHNPTRDPLDLIYVTATGGRTQPDSASLPELPPPSVALEAMAPTAQKEEPPAPPILMPSASGELAVAPKPLEVEPSASNEAGSPERQAGESLVASEKSVAPDDYLASSEELLKSLGEKQARKEKETERNSTDSLLSPLGIGSMLLFLLASATFGYVATNPSGLKHLSVNRLFNQKTPTAVESPGHTQISTNGAVEAPLPTSPNLASQEFVDLDLDTLSTLNPKPSPTPALEAKPSPVSSPISSPIPQVTVKTGPVPTPKPAARSQGLGSLTAALLPPSSKRTSNQQPAKGQPLAKPPVPKPANPAPVTVTPTITLTPAATPTPAATANPESVTEDYFYVVLDYDGDQSLEKARQVVADAYARDFPTGSQIQLGAFNDAATAQVLVQQLQKQGLAAKVYRP